MDKPSILGGKPAFKELVSIIKPPLYRYSTDSLFEKFRQILNSGMVTNHIQVQELERRIQEYLNVGNTVAISSCTSGLMLSLQLLGVREKEVIIPGFTFLATAHGAYWNNCKIKFVDIDPNTLNISIEDLQEKISTETAAIMPVHIYGNPCDVKALEELANDYSAKLIFDSAHGFGASYNGVKVGNFGDAEIFSCSPTKLFITMEGGIVTTNHDGFAEKLKLARNYGNTGDNECDIPGLNARMTEINALLGQEMLTDTDEIVKNRNKYADIYRKHLSKLPGVGFQRTTKGATHAFKDFSIIIDPEKFGINRDILYDALNKENVMTKKYFYPPIHRINAYKDANVSLPIAESISKNVLSLPLYSYMDEEVITKVCFAIERIHDYVDEINKY